MPDPTPIPSASALARAVEASERGRLDSIVSAKAVAWLVDMATDHHQSDVTTAEIADYLATIGLLDDYQVTESDIAAGGWPADTVPGDWVQVPSATCGRLLVLSKESLDAG